MLRAASLSSMMGAGAAITAAAKAERRVIKRTETMMFCKGRRCQARED